MFLECKLPGIEDTVEMIHRWQDRLGIGTGKAQAGWRPKPIRHEEKTDA
jgi:hypothetical protein